MPPTQTAAMSGTPVMMAGITAPRRRAAAVYSGVKATTAQGAGKTVRERQKPDEGSVRSS